MMDTLKQVEYTKKLIFITADQDEVDYLKHKLKYYKIN